MFERHDLTPLFGEELTYEEWVQDTKDNFMFTVFARLQEGCRGQVTTSMGTLVSCHRMANHLGPCVALRWKTNAYPAPNPGYTGFHLQLVDAKYDPEPITYNINSQNWSDPRTVEVDSPIYYHTVTLSTTV